MKKDRILTIIIFIVGILILGESYNIIKTLNTKDNKVLENVKTMNIFDNKDKTLSIMLQEDGINFTEAKDRNAWPDIKKYTYDKSECVDSTGAIVDYKAILTFNYDSKTPTITVKTKNTVYCTLYFVKGKDTLTLLQDKGGDTFVEKSGMWRFVGTASQVLNNYICFGTTDPTVCKNEPDKYMYRIIGMTIEGDTAINLDANRLKLIKAIPSNESQAWNSDRQSSEEKWEVSSAYDYLNGTKATDFLPDAKSNQWQNGTYWNELITSQNWYIQDQRDTPEATIEPTGVVTSAASKIGLMYATDYVNAYQNNSLNNWLYVKNGWSGITTTGEWTMTRFGSNNGALNPWLVNSNGKLNHTFAYNKYAVRPVFYLKSNVMLSGSGTTTDPFRIAG